MRVLFFLGAADIPGGHGTQFRETIRELARLGVETRQVSSEGTLTESDLDGIDVVHAFWPTPEALRLARNRRIPVVVSTVYWPRDRRHSLDLPTRSLAQVANRLRVGASLGVAALQKKHLKSAIQLLHNDIYLTRIFEMADLLLPNSLEEGALVHRELNVTTPIHVVPNGVVPRLGGRVPWEGRTGVISVGRIDPHKNQLSLIHALRRGPYHLTILGPDHPHHPRYAAACRRTGGAVVTFPGGVSHLECDKFMGNSRVHVLPSWYETTGLASLEAAVAGCAIVTTHRGNAKTYFGSLAHYCDPASERSIRNAVDAAYATPPNEELRDRVLSQFTWKAAASATLSAYEKVLSR